MVFELSLGDYPVVNTHNLNIISVRVCRDIGLVGTLVVQFVEFLRAVLRTSVSGFERLGSFNVLREFGESLVFHSWVTFRPDKCRSLIRYPKMGPSR